jgi:hypothetical protein
MPTGVHLSSIHDSANIAGPSSEILGIRTSSDAARHHFDLLGGRSVPSRILQEREMKKNERRKCPMFHILKYLYKLAYCTCRLLQ